MADEYHLSKALAAQLPLATISSSRLASGGLSYTAAPRQWLLRPLGLRNTDYTESPYPRRVLNREPAAFFWDPSCERYEPSSCPPSVLAPLLGQELRTANLSYGGAAGGMVLTLGDLARWYHALFNGLVLGPQQLAELTSLVSKRTGQPIADVSADDPQGFCLGLIDPALIDQNVRPSITGANWAFPHLGTQDNEGRHYNKSYNPALSGSYWFYQGETRGARTLIAYWPQYDLAISASANSAVAATGKDDQLGVSTVPPSTQRCRMRA
jgi:D-alanyl-D-alanine carboxypeptidase